jgi:hypothetical protein
MGTIQVKLRDDYKRSSHSVDATKVTKDEYIEVDESVNSVQNLLDEDILVKKTESESSEGDDSGSSDTDEESFECDECGDSFDSERGVKAHKGQLH